MKKKSSFISFIAGAFSLFHNKAGVTFDGSERRLQTCGGLTAQLFDSTSPASFMCVSFFFVVVACSSSIVVRCSCACFFGCLFFPLFCLSLLVFFVFFFSSSIFSKNTHNNNNNNREKRCLQIHIRTHE